jgi:hypothetical protein
MGNIDMNRLMKIVIPAALAASFLAACGGDDDGGTPDAAHLPDGAVSDAGPDASTVDAAPDASTGPDAFMPPGNPSCDEFTTPIATISTFPSTYEGDLASAEANINISDAITCTQSNAPTGQVGAGPDQVVALTGLTPGTTYFVVLTSSEDLATYVVTGCDASNPGPGADQCLAFADAELANSNEAQKFIAPADGKAFVVVDYWSGNTAPSPTTYSLKVTTDACASNDDCASVDAPVCDVATRQCTPTCVGDDTTAEVGDDSTAGATPIAVNGGAVSINAHVCNNPAANPPESDFYKVTVADGGAFTVGLAWADTDADLDVTITDASETVLGVSYWENPETVKLNYLAAGTYFIQVTKFAPRGSEVTPYTLTLTPDPTAACTSSASCAEVFRNQVFRPTCNAMGACVAVAGAGAVAHGGLCDDPSDCMSGVCGNGVFVANADTRNVCTENCTTDADCTAVGTGYKCTDFGGNNFCLPPCTTDEQCPASPGDTPPAGQPWLHATCVVAEGRCKF